jgi:LAO/AO transport system kinase
MDLAAPVLAGDRRALARLITQIENGTAAGQAALAALWPHTGRAHIVGITGPSGSGKSTLVNAIAKHLRTSPPAPAFGHSADKGPASPAIVSAPLSQQEKGEGKGVGSEVAIVAVDPTSPFSGGAILGDRIRMRDLSGDPGIFIRSMATRGSLGGLARATASVVDALDSAGFGVILVETVGAGQSEVEIARAAHTVIVVEAPGLGDDVQAAKAGILEIADILVVNKADQPGAEAAARALRHMLELGSRKRAESGWEVPIHSAVATEGSGIPQVVQAIVGHREHLQTTGRRAARERERIAGEMQARLGEALLARARAALASGEFEAAVERVLARQADPGSEVERLAALSQGRVA